MTTFTKTKLSTTEWDFVIVGGGSAGSVIAARLSESSSVNVLLLEAGADWRAADAPEAVRSPELWSELMLDPAHNSWHWRNVSARRTTAQDSRSYRQGRGLGGSSVINGMVALRPPLSDFDKWNRYEGREWSAQEVLRSFVRLEDDAMFRDLPYHGVNGPIPIHRSGQTEWTTLDAAFVDAAIDSGYSWTDDQNSPEPDGVGCYPCNLRNDKRVTANDAYLEPARHRQNLLTLGHSLVDRILFESAGQRAIGVRFQHEDEWQSVECGQVVLCAGAIQSPAILMRSGVGPADDLRRLGIKVLHDAPVGLRLQDHPMLALSFESLEFEPQHAKLGHNVVLRFPCILDDDEPQTSELMIHPAYQNDRFSQSQSLFLFLLRCYSRGLLRLISKDPHVAPEIDLGLLRDNRDLKRIREAAHVALTLSQHASIKRTAGAVKTDLRSASDLEILSHVSDAKHISCTCPMGNPGDEGVVVNVRGEVLGVTNVRVADMSIAPSVPRANTYLTAVMIGEHIAEMIQQKSLYERDRE